jgi:hypothetical protein
VYPRCILAADFLARSLVFFLQIIFHLNWDFHAQQVFFFHLEVKLHIEVESSSAILACPHL